MLAAARAAGLLGGAAALPPLRPGRDRAARRRGARASAGPSGVRIVAPGEAAAGGDGDRHLSAGLRRGDGPLPGGRARPAGGGGQPDGRARPRRHATSPTTPLRVRAHLAELLGGEGLWAPISARVRAPMAADPRYPAGARRHLDAADRHRRLVRRAPRWRGDARAAAGARPARARPSAEMARRPRRRCAPPTAPAGPARCASSAARATPGPGSGAGRRTGAPSRSAARRAGLPRRARRLPALSRTPTTSRSSAARRWRRWPPACR